jgi:hypothetical protein
MIVKAQVSLASGDGVRRALITDRSGRIAYQTEKPEEVEAIASALRGDAKGYFKARHLPDGKVSLDRRTGEQDW